MSNTKGTINPKGRPWSLEESRFVWKNYGPLTVQQLGEKLGRTKPAVAAHIQRLTCGLVKGFTP